MKGFPLQPVGKGLGVCSKGVLKQPSIITSYGIQRNIQLDSNQISFRTVKPTQKSSSKGGRALVICLAVLSIVGSPELSDFSHLSHKKNPLTLQNTG